MESRINVSGSNEAAEAGLIIDHLPSIWWRYELVDLRSGTLLDSGSVPAFQESRAASRIADMLVLHLASYRSFKQVSTKRINSGLKIDSSYFGSWRVWQILETLENPEPVPREITVGLQGGNLIGSSSDGQVAFSIDTHGILDVDFDGSAYVRLTPDSMLNEYPNLLYYIKIPRYRVHIAWNDDNVTRIVTLQAPKARLRELYSKLAGVISP